MQEKIIYPSQIILEVTNRCNIRCRFCHFHGIGAKRKRKIGDMDPSIWQKVIDEISQWDRDVTLMSHGAGEPLLYKELPELLKYAKRHKNIHIGFMTNGMLFSSWWADFVLDIQMEWIAFSVDGTDKDKHAHYRIGTDLDLIEKNIMYLIEKKQRLNLNIPNIMMNMVVYPHMEDEKISYFNKWKDHVNTIVFSKFRPIGSRKIIDNNKNILKKPCAYPFNQFVISFDGRVGLCCEDINLDAQIGDVKKNTILEIFNSPKINTIRRHHKNLEFDKISICSDCDIWAGDIILDKKEIENFLYKKTPAGEIYEQINT